MTIVSPAYERVLRPDKEEKENQYIYIYIYIYDYTVAVVPSQNSCALLIGDSKAVLIIVLDGGGALVRKTEWFYNCNHASVCAMANCAKSH